MRISSELWVKAFVRRCSASGAPAFVVRHGDDERGAVYLKVAMLNGSAKLFGPAPASLSEQVARMLVAHLDPAGAPERDVDAYMARQVDFDPDLWLVELEDRAGRSFLED